ncbi:MAG: amino acid adenylation domain-containing protein, partial [Bacteroidales bacterium]|nr:amino acid adenylation domain-containing protein [Bacteroidales bacterium]
VFENFPIAEKIENLDNDNEQLNIQISGVDTFEQTNYNLTISASLTDVLHVNFIYNANMFDSEMMKSLKIHFENVIHQIVSDSEVKISAIDILTEEEKHQLLYEFNNTEVEYPKDKTIHRLFEEQVEKTPDNVALVYEGKEMSYRELNTKANQLAHLINTKGIKSGSIVGIMQDTSFELIIGIIGILKSGGAYLPIDPMIPQSRKQFILDNSQSDIFLSSSTDEFQPEIKEIIYLDSENTYQGILKNPQHVTDSSCPCYVLYTSGSTGVPKGVVIEHRSVVNFIYSMYNDFKGTFSSIDNCLSLTRFSFDVSVAEYFLPFSFGSKVVLFDYRQVSDIEFLAKIIIEHEITFTYIPPSLLNSVYEILRKQVDKVKLNKMLVGVEPITHETLGNYFSLNKEFRIINGYGPTEATICATRYLYNSGNIPNRIVPIGRGLSNNKIYLLDSCSNLVPIGGAGELCISGAGLSRGYLNNPEFTTEKFIPNPFKEGERLYRTGDLARWLPDGNIEFVGRIDYQVKIRGFRIELGEIENALLKHKNIKESVVLAREEKGDKYLCAYIVNDGEFNQDELRAYISAQLPDYMVPSYFVELESLPLTANGKVNRKALPSPEVKAGDDYVAPSNEIEEKLLEIWSEVLNIDKEDISVNDNFFSIGGHSLKATVLTSNIHKEIGVEFPLREVFLHSTIKSQASQIAQGTKKDFVSITKAKEQSNYPVSSAQKRLYLLQQFDLTSTAYNMPYVISLGKELDKSKIEDIFKQLINRHESFRTSIIAVDGEPVQVISKDIEFELEELSIEKTEVENTRNKFIKPFALSKAPFLRVAIVDIKGENSLLMLDMHHIISDGASHIILEKEFQALLSGEELAPLPLQYKDYSEWQNSKEQQEGVKDQEQYWLSKFEGEIPVLNLPIDYVRPLMQSHEGATVSFVLNKEETEGIKFFTKKNDLTLYMSLLSVFSILLSKLSGQDEIIVGTPVAGRNHADLENIVGMFVNTLSIRNEVKGEENIRDFVSSLKQTVLGAYENQNYQFEDLVDKVSVERDTSRHPIFDVGLNLLNQAEQSGDISGIDDLIHTKGISKFDLALIALDYGEQLMFSFEYCTKLFKAETIDRFIVYFKQIIDQLGRSSEIKISEIDILTEEEKYQLLYTFNDTKLDYPKDKTIDQLFEEQVIKSPNNVALSINIEKECLHQLLESKAQERIALNEYSKICFDSNQTFFHYNDEIYKSFDVYNEKDLEHTVLIRNLRNDLLILDRRIFSLLPYFNSETNLRSIYDGLKIKHNDLRIIELNKVANSIEFDTKKQFFDFNSFEEFINLINILYKYSLITPVKIKKENIELHINNEISSDSEYIDLGKANNKSDHSDTLLCEIKSKENVLLLGGTRDESTVGLLYLASYLRKNGVRASCQWYNPIITNEVTEQYIREIIAKERPTIVGISMKWFLHIQKVIEFSKLIKKIDPSIKVVLGGNTASYYCDSLIKLESIDYIVLGDGELPILKICLGENDIPNCVSKKNGEVKKSAIDYVQEKSQNSEIHLLKLDEILVSLKDLLHVNSFYVNTGKGCSMQCFYCAGSLNVQKQSFNRRKPFLRDVKQVRNDILLVKDYVPTLMFDFDTPLFDSVDYFRDIWNDINLSNNNCEFYSWKLPSQEFIKLISETYKTIILAIDLATLSEKHRIRINKESIMKPLPSKEEIESFLETCKNYGNIKVKINLISGLPFLSREYLEESTEYSKLLMKRYPFIIGLEWGRLHAQPGAPILANLDKFDMHSYATTFEDFRNNSELNCKEKEYPNLEHAHYPYIYFNDDTLNSLVSKNYYNTNKAIDKIISSREKITSQQYNITYQSLNEKANQMAHYLQGEGLVSGDIVGILMESSIDMVTSLLGILKSGSAYLPISTDYPKDRINYILQNSKPKVLITSNRYYKEYSDLLEEINIIDVQSIQLDSYPSIKPVIKEDHLKSAYVIYTSGTTGKPKGVLVEHKAIVNTLIYRRNSYKLTEVDRSLQLFSFSFDGFVTSFFTPLISGSELVLLNENEGKDINAIIAKIQEKRITHFICVPALYSLILEFISEDEASSIKCVTLAGDKLPIELVKKTINKNKNIQISHEYGVTEAAVMSTICKHQEKEGVIKIGKPIVNTQIFILDKNRGISPINILGELCISGDGLSLGYLNNPELTKEKFIDHPFKEGERLYKTGDQARWLPDGNIEFLGRIDHQVKIRGFRIELGEIENTLLKHKNIKESVVLAREENGDKYLCAYVLGKEELNHDELRAYMSSQLPDYMVPTYFVELDSFPLNSNGKVNRKALPSPEVKAGDDYVAPSTEIEEKLLEIWSEVLNIDKEDISVNANFFSIGGHSLKATVLTSKIHKEIGVEFPLREVFLHSTIKSQATQIEKSTKKDFVSIPKAKEQSNYPLSSAQKRLYMLQQFDLISTAYNMPNIIPLGKEVDKSKIEEAFKQLINRHESFRTSIIIVHQEPVQLINKNVEFEIEEIRIENSELENIQNKFIKPFDLSKAPFLRVAIVDIKGEDSLLMIDMHHIISDGSSHTILEKEFQTLYLGEELAPLPLQYKDYSEWQNSEEQQEIIKDQEQYWLSKFEGEIPVLNLPIDYVRPLVHSHDGATVNFVLSKEETEGLRFFTKENDLTLYMSLLSVFSILLSKLSGQDDIVVGTPIAGRNHADLENIVGMFINTLSIRNEVKGEETIQEFVSGLKQTVLGAYENQNYQFEDLVDKVSVERDTSHNPIFDVMINLLNQADYSGDISGLDSENRIHTKGVSKFDLTLIAIDYKEQLLISFNYCTQLFKAETIDRFIVYFKQIVSQLVRNSEVKISEIDILSKEEKHQLLYEFNNTKADYPKDKTIHRLFEEQVELTPDNIALVYEGKEISYRELNKRSNQTAHYLIEKGIKREDIVGIELESSYQYVVSIFAVLKAGGAFLPIDKKLPDLRKKYIVENSELKILIHNDNNYEKNAPENIESINIEKLDLTNYPVTNPAVEINPSNLAYVIYTSGSTGKPKGTLLEHKGIVSENIFWKEGFKIHPTDRCLQFANISFDASVAEIYSCLFNGASLYIPDENIKKDISLFEEYLIENKITVATFPPPFADNLNERVFKNFRLVITAGSETNSKLIEKINKNAQYINAYGPTETSICATYWDTSEFNKVGKIVIGRSIQNIEAYIIDSHLQLQGIGIPGELCFSGEGLARGYLKNPELTAEKFIPHPFKEGERLYRTGDLARWLPDGNIEFIGRIDHQVKIRGFRIELGEIESTLLKHENIKESVVLARDEKGEKYLCAYVVCKEELNHEELRTYISAQIPDYMVPSYFVQLDELPLTSNGKVNRKALPSPEIKAGDNYVAPKTKEESILVDVWSKVLGVEGIGITDNFFSLGGDSIKTIQIQARLNTAGFKISVKDIFLNPIISDLATKMIHKSKEVSQEIIIGDFKLSPIQYYFLSDETEQHHYNQSVMLHSEEYLEEEKIQSVFRKLQEHHDALRITCKLDNARKINGLYNNGIDGFPVSLEVYDFREEKEASEKIISCADQIQRSIDLETGPLLKLGLFHLQDGDRLLIVIHHLVIDGISWRIIFEEIETLFNQVNKGEKLSLPLKSNSFRDWSTRLTEYSKTSQFLKEKSYWKDIVSKEEISLNRQIDNENLEDNDLGHKQFTLDQIATTDLLNNTNEIYGTEINDILLCGLGYGVKKTLGNEKVFISLEGHGREDILPDLDISRTIGWFTTVYPVLLDMKHIDDLSLQIRSVKEKLRQIPNKGIGFGILKYLTPPELKDDVNYDIEPQIEFNYLGQFDSDVEQMSLFKIAKESGGNPISPNRKNNSDFSIGGMIAGGKLSVNITYKKKYYSEELIDNLLENYKKSLLEILNHCTKHTEKVLTPSDFTYQDLSIKELDKLVKQYEIEDIYKLTPMQEGMLFHAMHDSESFAYFEQMNYRLQSELSVELMRKSLNELFTRHDILRTVFIYKEMQIPLQLVLKDRECEFDYKDIRELSTEEKKQYILNYKKTDRERGFRLDQDILMRVSLLQINHNEYELIWSNHHILMDGWCISIINNDFFDIYNGLLNNRTLKLNSVTPYKEYLKWLDGIDKNTSLKYWKEYLSGYEEQASLPNLSKKGNEFIQQKESLQLSKEVSARFQKIASDNNVTANIILQSVWAIVLGKYSNKEDIVFGSVVSGRPSEIYGVENIVGLFINNVPVRIQFSQDLEFNTLIKQVQNSNLDSETHHYISLAEIQSQSILQQNLIDHIIVFENFPIAEKIESLDRDNEQLSIQISGVDTFEQTNYNLTISASLSDVLHVNFIYNANMFDSDMMKSLKIHFENVIHQIVSDSELRISAIDILSEEEKQQLLYEFNDTKADYPKDKAIHQLFEEQVAKTPDNIAVSNDGNSLTYSGLNKKANHIAQHLLKIGINRDDIVTIFLDRSIETVYSMLGVLKSGGAYLPLDPDYPDDRIDFILNDSRSKIVISTKDFSERIEFKGSIICVEEISVLENNISNIEIINKPSDLCYIIYTSGTTGMPKGVMIEHRNAVRLFFNEKFQFDFSEKDVWTMFHSHCFDFSVWEMYGALLYGGKLIVIPKIVARDVVEYYKLLREEKVTVLNQTPSAFYNLSEIALQKPGKSLENLRYVIFGGEALKPNKLAEWFNTYSDVKLINMYGITETTVHVTYKEICEYEIANNISNIGVSIPTLTTYVVDNNLKLVPKGVVGELLIGGDGLSRGYLGREELTKEKFIKNPYKPEERLYRSGDLVKMLSDGDLEYHGRIDDQVQLRGFRIELGEIESVLLKHENIKESVVLAIEKNNEKYLCAYVVSKEEFSHEELRAYMSAQLPDYMLPSYFVELESLPLNANGKVNRKALPSPEIKAGDDYVAPSNEIEEKLVKIWSEVLNVTQEEISTTANFFAIGGHSLKATILVSNIHKELSVKLPLKEIFQQQTIKKMAVCISEVSKLSYSSIKLAEKKEYYTLSSAQKRLYFIQQLDFQSISYNMPMVIHLGSDIKIDSLENAFAGLVSRHESFRTSFVTINNESVQRLYDNVDFKLDKKETTRENLEKDIKEYIKPFDLSKDILIRACLMNVSNEQYVLVVDMHHIISDGSTRNIVREDFLKLFNGEKIAPLKLQYKDFSNWQNTLIEKGELKSQETYWKDLFSGDIPMLNLQTDYKRPESFTSKGDICRFSLDEDETSLFRELGKGMGSTLYMNILAVLNTLFYRFSNQEDIIIGSGIAGRQHTDLQGISGMFINTLAMRNYPNGDKTYLDFLKEVSDNSIAAFENQDIQFEDLVDMLNIDRDISRNPLFDI